MAKYKKNRRNYKNAYNKKLYIDKILFYIFLVVFILFICSTIKRNSTQTNIYIENVSAFQISSDTMIQLSDLANECNLDFAEVLTVYALENNFFEEKILEDENLEREFLINYKEIKDSYDEKEFNIYYNLINGIIQEIQNFPIGVEDKGKYIYSDSWGAERTYGGNRIHQGTDIMDKENIEGNIAIISMTDGVIEKLGWNEKGGYRVGVRTENGNYYYYAHLSDFALGLEEGMKVKAGQLLGYMGNTGYSKVEGTKGNFSVHLHMGIEVVSEISSSAFWINPYPFLTYIEYLEES